MSSPNLTVCFLARSVAVAALVLGLSACGSEPNREALGSPVGASASAYSALCGDEIKNNGETAVDCGGPQCGPCGTGAKCLLASDCVSQVCKRGYCAAPGVDGVRNGDESDVDCGGTWPSTSATAGCPTGKKCLSTNNCVSGDTCVGSFCTAPSCSDGIKNGSETDVDCGGSCPNKCVDGSKCLTASDCVGNLCSPSTPGAQPYCRVPNTCADGRKDADETGVDCGGSCKPCSNSGPCNANIECKSGVCTNHVCQTASCSDGVKNGSETGVDCGGGGNGSGCPACGVSGLCKATTDCAAGLSCKNGICESLAGAANLCLAQGAGANYRPPVVCVASDACHAVGTCNPVTGACSNPAAPDGSACNDGDACTQTDHCVSGACSGSNPVVCTAADQCHIAGVCNSSTGTCSVPNAPDGTPCMLGDGVLGEACLAGACVLSVTLPPIDASLTIWLDAGRLSSLNSGLAMVKNGSAITEWGPFLNQSSAQAGFYESTGFNGYPVIDFTAADGSAAGFLTSADYSNPTGSYTIAVVLLAPPNLEWPQYVSAGNDLNIGLEYGHYGAYVNDWFADIYQSYTIPDGNPAVLAIAADADAHTLKSYFDDVLKLTDATYGMQGSRKISVLKGLSVGSGFGKIAELLLYDRTLSERELLQLNTYLFSKYRNPGYANGTQQAVAAFAPCSTGSHVGPITHQCAADVVECIGGYEYWLGTEYSTCIASKAADQCHMAGVCNSSTGTCSVPNAPDGTPCMLGDGVLGEACLAGACVLSVTLPPIDASLTIWLDAGRLSSLNSGLAMVKNGSAITEWGPFLNQSSAQAGFYESTGFNGYPVIDFTAADGSAAGFLTSADYSNPTGSYTIAVVLLAPPNLEWPQYVSAGNDLNIGLEYGHYGAYVNDWFADIYQSYTIPDGNPAVLAIAADADAHTLKSYFDDVLKLTDATYGMQGSRKISVLKGLSVGSGFGKIAELLLYDRTLSERELLQLNTYLFSKYRNPGYANGTQQAVAAFAPCPTGSHVGPMTHQCTADVIECISGYEYWLGTAYSTCIASSTCYDGIKNGNETGVDCGGSCPVCVSTTSP